MASIEDTLQVKNRNVARVNAPLLGNYPNGYVDSVKLPMALTWVTSTRIDEAGILGINEIQIDVFTQSLAQGVTRAVKKAAKDLRDLFLAEYPVTASNMYIQNDPAIKIVPGSIVFGGYRELIEAPDETPFHGFQITMTAEANLEDVECD